MAASESQTSGSQTSGSQTSGSQTSGSQTSGSQTSGSTDVPESERFAEVSELTYEQARDELISIVARLEGGQIGLEDSMTLWERGEALANRCGAWLDGAEAKLRATRAGTARGTVDADR